MSRRGDRFTGRPRDAKPAARRPAREHDGEPAAAGAPDEAERSLVRVGATGSVPAGRPPAAADEDLEDGEVIEGEVVEGEALVGEILEEESPYIPLSAGQGVLVRRDPLSLYLAEINRFKRLSAEEEVDLARRWRTQGDHEAAARLVSSNLRLVVAVAMSFRRAIANVLDLIQEGNIGLMEAVERYDPDKGTRLSTYATWWIRSRIVKYLLDNWRLVRVGTTNARRKLLYNLRAERERLESMGIAPTPKLLADRLGTSEQDVVAVSQALGAGDQSLDAPLREDSDSTRGDMMSGAGPTPEEEASRAQLQERLKSAIEDFARDLSPRETSLLRERLLADDPVTLQDLAAREGVTREAVRQTEARLVARLREHLRKRLPEAAELTFGQG